MMLVIYQKEACKGLALCLQVLLLVFIPHGNGTSPGLRSFHYQTQSRGDTSSFLPWSLTAGKHSRGGSSSLLAQAVDQQDPAHGAQWGGQLHPEAVGASAGLQMLSCLQVLWDEGGMGGFGELMVSAVRYPAPAARCGAGSEGKSPVTGSWDVPSCK